MTATFVRYEGWVWRALSVAGVAHLCPPNPGRLATTVCGAPLSNVSAVQVAAFGAAKCAKCRAAQEAPR